LAVDVGAEGLTGRSPVPGLVGGADLDGDGDADADADAEAEADGEGEAEADALAEADCEGASDTALAVGALLRVSGGSARSCSSPPANSPPANAAVPATATAATPTASPASTRLRRRGSSSPGPCP
jgi:hypothetical protein